MKPIVTKIAAIAGAMVATAVMATPAAAQATRTWISGVGDDVNPCSRTAPCKTFAGAISKTAAGGEINCLDPGGFGGVTITKSISLVCDTTEGGVLIAGTNGIIVNAAGATVLISGIDLEGLGQSGSPSINGVHVIAVDTLHVRNTKIRGFRNGYGINFVPATAARLLVDNVNISESGKDKAGGGILIAPTGGTGSAAVSLTNVRVDNNDNTAFKMDTTNAGAPGISASISDSQFSGSIAGFTNLAPTVPGSLVINRTTVSHNTYGILGSGAGSITTIGNSTITGNGSAAALAVGSANVSSYGNNLILMNGSLLGGGNGTFSGTIPTR
jgi:hypothetical protein